jgi:catechol 2,3-dioxygenase-like lactoylglutathione lyase family enzyme
MSAPKTIGFFEVVLEVSDLVAAERFYCDGLGFPIVDRWTDDRPAIWVGVGNEGYLGLWLPESGGAKGLYGSRGGAHVHLAIRVGSGDLPRMRDHLSSMGIEIAGDLVHSQGNSALYVRDDDDHLIEITDVVQLWDGTAPRHG